MNKVFANGTILTIPKLSIMKITEEEGMALCKFYLGSIQENNGETGTVDRFPVVCFGNLAFYLKNNYKVGSKIILYGFFKNYSYKDANNTKHKTQVLVATEIADTSDGNISNLNDVEVKGYKVMEEKGYSMIDDVEIEFLETIYK